MGCLCQKNRNRTNKSLKKNDNIPKTKIIEKALKQTSETLSSLQIFNQIPITTSSTTLIGSLEPASIVWIEVGILIFLFMLVFLSYILFWTLT